MYHFLASGFGSGYLPFMPGTWGTVVGVFLCWFLIPFGLTGFFTATFFTFFIGWGLSHKLVCKQPTDRDPSYIVIDEIAGIFFTCALAGLLGAPLTLLTLGAGFIWFRLFDIWKPFPINWVDKKLATCLSTAGLGVMIDDLLAAVPAGILTCLFHTLLHRI